MATPPPALLPELEDEDAILRGLPCDFAGCRHHHHHDPQQRRSAAISSGHSNSNNNSTDNGAPDARHQAVTIKCGRCRCAFYCSTDCQIRDWKKKQPQRAGADGHGGGGHQSECVAYNQRAAREHRIVPSRQRLLEDDDADDDDANSNQQQPCGLCGKSGLAEQPQPQDEDATATATACAPRVRAPCGHVFCFGCLQRHVSEKRRPPLPPPPPANNDDSDDNNSKENNPQQDDNGDRYCPRARACPCPACGAELLRAADECVADLWRNRARDWLWHAARADDDSNSNSDDSNSNNTAEREEILRQGRAGAARAYGKILAAREATAELRQAGDGDENSQYYYCDRMMELGVPSKLYWETVFAKAALDMKSGHARRVLREMEELYQRERRRYRHHLQQWLGDAVAEDDPLDSEDQERARGFLKEVKLHGLTVHAIDERNQDLRCRIFRIKLSQAKAHEELGEWEAAQKILDEWNISLSVLPPDDAAALQTERARCALQLGDYEKATEYACWAARTIRAGRRVPGNHRLWAEALKQLGEVEAAMAVVKTGIVYEAPWDLKNKEANKAAYAKLAVEVEERAETRRKEEAFLALWGKVLSIVQEKHEDKDAPTSWESIKEKDWDMLAGDGEDGDNDDSLPAFGEEETALKVQEATRTALMSQEEETELSDGAWADGPKSAKEELDYIESGPEEECLTEYVDIMLTRGARKNVNNLEVTKREAFVRKLDDLAFGRGGLTTRKALVGCKNVRIFETYLDNSQSAHRILWTELDKRSICIWYVVKHTRVSKMMKMIDEADERSERRLTSASVLLSGSSEMDVDAHQKTIGSDRVFLDPFSDTPLKVYEIPRDEILKLASPKWTPRLHLTKQEKEIVATDGTILLLGRSGTGKTVCICERIARDRHHADINIEFRQLFVARSLRICNIVSSLVGSEYEEENQHLRKLDFFTFKKLLDALMERLPGEAPRSFDKQSYVDFQRFKRDFQGIYEKSGLDALVIWTQIRSFIKGSVEALLKPGATKFVTMDEYLDFVKFGPARCRLPKQQREIAYEIFVKYEKEKGRLNLWDDCDLLTAIHAKFDESTLNNTFPEDLYYDKLYVDEVQDYTQSEIALFFKLCKPGNLFLAGDAAQAVVEGVEFRFEEIRSTVYTMMRDEDKQDPSKRSKIIPSKPMKVTVNFRSHSGILNVAAVVLDVLFGAFPNSAPDLGKDCGVFQGPRPGFFENVSDQQLSELVAKIEGVHILTRLEHDVTRLQELVGDKQFVLSIKDSKGLEFTDVILVDFFKGLESNLQKPWREMLRVHDGRSEKGITDALKEYQDQFPEIETHLKHLYTAVTRCKTRFFIVETGSSLAGDQFAKWLMRRDQKLMSRQYVHTVEKIVKTADQWAAQGLEYAKRGEPEADFEEAIKDFTRAKTAFEYAEDPDLLQKVCVHLDSLQLRKKIYFRKDTSSLAELVEDGDERSFEEIAMSLMMKLAEESLLKECSRLFTAAEPLLDDLPREKLRERLLPLLPDADD